MARARKRVGWGHANPEQNALKFSRHRPLTCLNREYLFEVYWFEGLIMNVSSVAAFASANAAQQSQDAVSIAVLKKALDIQAQGALQLIQALPATTASAPVTNGNLGTVINTWA